MRIVVYGSPAWADRFWAKVDKAHPSGCWVWTAAHHRDGYGAFWLDGRQVKAHRVAYALMHPGEALPDDKVVRHECDNPPCVRHLILGTSLENDLDRVKRGRSATGDRNGARLHRDRLPRGEASHTYRPNECRNWHPPERRYVSASGERRCRDCQAERRRRYRAKAKEEGRHVW
jgi:hypothetical protein